MQVYILRIRDRGTEWFKQRAHGAYAKFWLAVLSFTEASFFIIPPDVLLAAILLSGAERWRFYAAFTTIFSVLGGIFGYIIGAFLFNTVGVYIVETYNLSEQIQYIGNIFDASAFWVMFLASFTPIPYKAFVLAAGFFKVDFILFLVASIIGRGLRFFAVAYVFKRFGTHIAYILFRYFTILTYTLLGICIAWFVWHTYIA